MADKNEQDQEQGDFIGGIEALSAMGGEEEDELTVEEELGLGPVVDGAEVIEDVDVAEEADDGEFDPDDVAVAAEEPATPYTPESDLRDMVQLNQLQARRISELVAKVDVLGQRQDGTARLVEGQSALDLEAFNKAAAENAPTLTEGPNYDPNRFFAVQNQALGDRLEGVMRAVMSEGQKRDTAQRAEAQAVEVVAAVDHDFKADPEFVAAFNQAHLQQATARGFPAGSAESAQLKYELYQTAIQVGAEARARGETRLGEVVGYQIRQMYGIPNPDVKDVSPVPAAAPAPTPADNARAKAARQASRPPGTPAVRLGRGPAPQPKTQTELMNVFDRLLEQSGGNEEEAYDQLHKS